MKWSSDAMYNSELTAAPSVQDHLIEINPEPQNPKNEDLTDFTTSSLFLLDTSGCQMYEQLDSENGSKYNIGEATLVSHFVSLLLSSGILKPQIGIVTPYNAQVKLLRKHLKPHDDEFGANLEISTVDGFQGREKDIIIISMVRSNYAKNVGFL